MPEKFIEYLYSLAERQDRAALAALRRGLGKPPGTVPDMYPYVVPWLPADLYRSEEAAYYLVAALFAFHPSHTDQGNMGDHMAAARDEGNNDSLERRFVALLSAHPDDLPDYLRQAVSFLRSKEIPINWERLFRDLKLWGHPERGDQIRKQWAASFWRYRKPEEE